MNFNQDQQAAWYQWWYANAAASVGGYNAAYFNYANQVNFGHQPTIPSTSSNQSTKKPKQPKQPPQKKIINCSVCAFTGTKKDVELHQMDRHLIYPPGFLEKEAKKKASKPPPPPTPVEGTNIMLDTPEAIEAWISERKRKFPSAANVIEKNRIKSEKEARGEIPLESRFKSRSLLKRTFESNNQKLQLPKRPKVEEKEALSEESSENEDVNPITEAVSSKIPPKEPSKLLTQERLQRRRIEPKSRIVYPFQQPNLIRNLFDNEIKQSLSYLSQAIKFLVANDFLENVELEVGQAEEPNLVEEINDNEQPNLAEKDVGKPKLIDVDDHEYKINKVISNDEYKLVKDKNEGNANEDSKIEEDNNNQSQLLQNDRDFKLEEINNNEELKSKELDSKISESLKTQPKNENELEDTQVRV